MSAWVWLAVGIVAAGALVGLSVVPLPGYCNVSVTVTNSEVPVLVGEYFTISSVNPSVSGRATALDWGGWLPAGFAWATVGSQFTEKVSVGPSSTQKAETQLLPSLPTGSSELQADDTFSLAYVPAGEQPVTVTLDAGSTVVATGSSSINVGC